MGTFFTHVGVEGGYWGFGQVEQAKYERGISWAHPIANLKDAADFARSAKSLRVRGGASLRDQQELRSLTDLLRLEAKYASLVGDIVDTFSKRFLFPWKFDAESIADLRGPGSVLEVESEQVVFKCRHGVSFALSMTVAKVSRESPDIRFRFNAVKFQGNCQSRVEVKAYGHIVTPRPVGCIASLGRAYGGTCLPEACTCAEDACTCGEDEDDLSTVSSPVTSVNKWLPFSQLLSVVRIHIVPVSLCIGPVVCVNAN